MNFNRLFLLVLLFCTKLFCQESSTNSFDSKRIKHQIGIGINNFINSAFSSDKNAYNLEYRYNLKSSYSLRSGLIYEMETSESGYTQAGLKFGIDKKFRTFKKWNFYYGVDVLTSYSNFKNINKDNYTIGLSPLLGIQYLISENFSISIEPNFYYNYNIIVDNSTFQVDNITEYSEAGLGKLGYIQLNFHF